MIFSKGRVCEYFEFNPKETLKKNQEYKKIAMENIVPKYKFINKYSLEKYKGGSKFKNGDTIFARITPCLENGKIAYIDCLEDDEIAFGSTEYIVLRAIESKMIPEFVYYFAISDYFKNKAISLMTGTSGRQRVQTDALKALNVKIPDIISQKKIVKILSIIDKKIKLNNGINNNLHEYAQELFKNWFIDFKYPNSTENKIKTELGLIPSGWSVGYFDDGILTKIIKSGVNKFDGKKKYIATADVNDSSINNYTMVDFRSKPSRANMTPIADSIWFAKMEGSKKNILVTNYTKELIDDYIFSTGFMGIKCLNNSINYLWELINSDHFQLGKDSLSTGTLMAGISNTTIKNYKYLVPSQNLLNDYNEIMFTVNNKIYNNQVENEKLSVLRDTLLPMLINGEINLDNVEI